MHTQKQAALGRRLYFTTFWWNRKTSELKHRLLDVQYSKERLR